MEPHDESCVFLELAAKEELIFLSFFFTDVILTTKGG